MVNISTHGPINFITGKSSRFAISATRENIPEAHKMADSVTCLPMHHALSEEEIDRVISEILKK